MARPRFGRTRHRYKPDAGGIVDAAGRRVRQESKLAADAGAEERAGEPVPRTWGQRLQRALPWLCVLGLFLSVAIPNYQAATRRPSSRACPANLKTIDGALEMWNLDHNGQGWERLYRDPGLLVEAGYLQQWPPGLSGGSYVLQDEGGVPVARCTRHGTMADFLARLR